MAYRARLESVCTSKGYRGFESLPLRHFFDAPPLCFFLSPNRNPTRNPSAPPCAALCAATLPLAPPSPQRCPRSGWLFGCSIQSGVALRFPPHSITDPPSVPLCALCGQHSPSPFAPFVSFVVGCSGCLSPTRPTGASTTDPFSVLLSGHFVFFVHVFNLIHFRARC